MTLRPSQRQTYAHVGPAVVRLTVSPSAANVKAQGNTRFQHRHPYPRISAYAKGIGWVAGRRDLSGYRHPVTPEVAGSRSEEHTSELQSRLHLVCRLLLEKKKHARTRSTTALSTP